MLDDTHEMLMTDAGLSILTSFLSSGSSLSRMATFCSVNIMLDTQEIQAVLTLPSSRIYSSCYLLGLYVVSTMYEKKEDREKGL
jgi:hypothetical protein